MRFALVGFLVCLACLVCAGCSSSSPVDLGASCSAASPPQACTKDGKLAACSGGKWQESMTCPGPKGCYRQNVGHGSTVPLCDDGLAKAGNVCADSRDVYCSEDRKTRLGCKGGRWQVQATCANGCCYTPNGITCE